LAKSVDFITAHVHPYWESLSIEHAAAHVMAVYIARGSLYPRLKKS
jgi:exo-beta-1,3-glucanase (GH17 family)